MGKLSRRTLFGTGAAVAAATAASAAASPLPSPTEVPPAALTIAGVSRQLRLLADRDAELDEALCKLKWGTHEHDELEEQFGRNADRMKALEDVILASMPTTPVEAVILLMHAADQVNRGNSSEDRPGTIERGEFAARRALRFFADALALGNLEEFAGRRYFGTHVRPLFSGRA